MPLRISNDSSKTRRCIAIVDDNQAVRESLSGFLKVKSDYRVVTFSSAEELLESREIPAVHLFIIDLGLPRKNGVELTQELRRMGIDIPIIISSGDGTLMSMIRHLPNIRYLQKPYRPSQLVDVIREMVDTTGQFEVTDGVDV